MSGMGEGQVERALEILLGNLEVLQGHVRALMTEEFHHRGKTDTRPQHLRSIGVTKLVRNDAGGNSDRRDDHRRPLWRGLVFQSHANAENVP